jgi:hypothetical protein
MAKRHNSALLIQEGACNPSGIARILVEVIDEVREEKGDPRRDPAVQLILHQLCHLAGMVVQDSSPHPNIFDWNRAYRTCIDKADEATVRTLKLENWRENPVPALTAAG